MAESYASFYGREPNIDVNLFPNANSAGINAGNAQKTPFQAAVGGIISGVGTALSFASSYQNIQAQALNNEAQAQQNEINADPAVQQARKDSIISTSQIQKDQAYASSLQAGITQANEETVKIQEIAKLETGALLAQQVLQDTKNKKVVQDALVRGSPEELNSILQDAGIVSTLSRDPSYGLGAVTAMRGKADPLLIDSVAKQVDSVELEKRRVKMLENEAELRQKKSIEFEDRAATAVAGIYSNPGVAQKNRNLGDKFNYQQLEIYPLDEVQIIDGKLKRSTDGKTIARKPSIGPKTGETAYVMAYGDDVVEPYMSHADGVQNQKWLNDYKVYASAKGFPTPAEDSTITTPAAPGGPTGLAAMAPATELPAPTTVNQNIVDYAKTRNQQYFNQAQKSGNGGSYEALIAQGQSIGRQRVVTKSEYLAPQSTPVAKDSPKVTVEVAPTETPATDIKGAEDKVSSLIGAPATIDTDVKEVKQLTPAVIERVNSIPAMQNQPALLKGVAVVESSGNPNAKAADGGAGLFQFMIPAASDVGLSDEDRLDPEKAAPAAIDYLQRQYDSIEKRLNKTFSDQGLAIKPDPRMVLAAYNGGLKAVLNGISAGNTTWAQLKEYLLANKSPTNGKINTEYPEKVILASIPFIKGGNASDDAYIRTLISFGIINV